MTFDTNTNRAYECPVCHGHHCEFHDAEDMPDEGYFDGAHLRAGFYCLDCLRPYEVCFTLRAEKSTPAGAVQFVVETTHGATAGQPGCRWWGAKYSSTLEQARAALFEMFTEKIAAEDRGEAYRREWRLMAAQAKTARPGEVLAFDEFAARITEQKEGRKMERQETAGDAAGFAFVFKLVKDGKDFQIDLVCVAGTDKAGAEKEAREIMLKRARKWPDEIVLTHCEKIGGRTIENTERKEG